MVIGDFLAACVQLSSTNEINHNITRIRELVADAAASGAKLIMLPENAFFMGSIAEDPAVYNGEYPGITACRELGVKHGIYILAGSYPHPSANGGKPYNRSAIIAPDGVVMAEYDKIHLFDSSMAGGESHRESSRFSAGQSIRIAELPWGKLGLSICYDLRFPYLFRKMALLGADFIAVPAAFTYATGVLHWHTLLRARAIENGCFVFAPAQTGTHANSRRTYGHSLIIDPWGKVIAEKPEGEGFITALINTTLVQDMRSSIPSLSHGAEI